LKGILPVSKNVLLYTARHGQTQLNFKNCFRGLADPELNASGRADAEKLAKFFQDIPLAAIFFSDKKRSAETARMIAAKHAGTPIFGTDTLWPWNVGMFSGQPKTPENVAKLEHFVQNPGIPIPKGESLNQFKNRIRPCLIEGMELANKAGKPVLFVVHSSVVHELGAFLNGGDHNSCLVKPGGVAQAVTDGCCIYAEPILKPEKTASRRADTIS
jgi:broad specificity phosphatase PhoE